MTNHDGQSWVLLCEGPSDERTVKSLVDAVLCEQPSWFAEQDDVGRDGQRRWLAPEGADYLCWKDLVDTCRRRRVMLPPGRFNGLHGDAVALDNFVRLVRDMRRQDPAITAAVAVRDMDNQREERTQALSEAQTLADAVFDEDFVFIVGCANAKIEAWLLVGVDCSSGPERHRFAEIQRELGFDPTRTPELLQASGHEAKTSAHRVFDELAKLSADGEFEARCRVFDHERWRRVCASGQACGLWAFWREIDGKMRPLLGLRPTL